MDGIIVDKAALDAPYDGDGRRFRLDIDHLAAQPGEKLALTGPSGAGKTTTLDFLALLNRPATLGQYTLTGPEIRLDISADLLAGHLDRLAPFRAGPIGYIPQIGGMLPFLSAKENALVPVRAGGTGIDISVRNRLAHLSEQLGLADHLSKYRKQLSGGERKRVSILRALIRPRLLLLADEPTAGLDDAMAERVMDLIGSVCATDKTICIMATHDIDRARVLGYDPVTVRRHADGARIARRISSEAVSA